MNNVIDFPTPDEPDVDSATEDARPWYEDQTNVHLTARWMLADGWEGEEIVSLYEKPWNYDDEFQQAAEWWLAEADAAVAHANALAESMERHPAGKRRTD